METEETAGSEYGNGNFDEDNSSVRVALRIRPPLPREQIEGCKTCTTVAEGVPQVWIGSNHAFTYDHVFDQNTPQNIIFDDVVKKLVDGCLHGYNATVLAYGQTGSGKTYTMGTGFEIDPSPDTQGIIPRAVTYLFMQMDNIKSESPELKADFKVEVNFVELYNEEVVDLLGQSSGGTSRPTSAATLSRPGSASVSGAIRIHEDTNGQIYVVGVRTVAVDSCHETLKILKDGALSRTTASTNMNDTSSRSHAIFTMHVTQKRISNEFGESELETLSAKFHFVDLAGSERLKRTLATGDRAKEGISINCGLLALGNVISALGDRTRKVSHVPYRDSKLTRLLQDSLGGNSRTVMLACVSPSDRDFIETLNTLKYANRARNIKNRIQINQDKSSRTIASLRREIELLQSELLEFKQGKRSVSDNYTDTHQENILLTTEIESLKSRLKSKQESIDKLTNTVATFETHKEIESLSGTDCDLTKMVQKYMHEIEGLRTKLYESEQECEKLRSKQRRLNTTLASPRQQVLEEVANHDILINAKADIVSDRKKLEQLSTKTDTDDNSDSESESEDQEKYEAIAHLTSEIGIKERLIEQLEQSQKRVEIMRVHYEEKIECLNNKIKGTQDERDKVLGTLKNGKRSAQVNADYEKKIAALQVDVKTWQKAQKEHIKVVRNQSQYQRQIENLKSEVDNLKHTKVKLVIQAKADNMKFRDLDMKRMKEINSLKKDQRVKDIKLKTLENDRIKKDQVLKRKLEEVTTLKKINKIHLSRKAQGKSRTVGSPIKAKSRWNNVQHEIKKAVSIKTTVSSLEKEMLNLIQERTESRKRLKDLEDFGLQDEDIDDEMESIKINLNFIEEKVCEIQNQIAEISSGVKDYDGSQLDEVEMHYVFKKMFEMNIGNLSEIERYERRVDDQDETIKQLNKEMASQRSLLQHLYSRLRNPQSHDEDLLPELPPPPENLSSGSEELSNTSKLRKARRLTSTPQELLGSLENVSKGSGFLNPNDVLPGNSFLRGNRMTQSLRLPSVNRKRPQLQRQDTYNVADRTFTLSYDPPEKLHEEPNRNNGDNFNTTFLVQKSPPSSSSFQNKLTNSTDSNNWDNTNMEGKGYIRRVSSGTKEKDKVLWLSHVAEGHTKPVISMYATRTKLFTGSKDSTAKVYDLVTGQEISCYIGHPSNVQCVKFVEETQTLFTVSGSIVKLWDTRSNSCIKTLLSSGTATDRSMSKFEGRLLQEGETQIQSIAIRRNYLYTTADNRIRVWDLTKLSGSRGTLAGKHSSNIMCLATAQDIKLENNLCDIIVSGSKDHYIKLYVIDPNQTIDSIRPSKNLDPPHYDGIESLLIKNTELYSGSRDTCIKKWDLAKAEMKCTASNAHSGWITGLSTLPDCYNLDYILSSSRDGSVKIWDSDLKEVLKVDIGMGSSTSNYCVESLCVNEELVFTAGGGSSNSNNSTASNGSISIWKLDEGALLASKVRGQSEYYRYPMSPRLGLNRKSNKTRYRSNEDLMTRSIGYELPY